MKLRKSASVLLPAAPSNSQLFSVAINRIDLILSNKKVIPLPVFSDATGADVLTFTKKYELRDFVICRQALNDGQYEVLYVDGEDKEISSMVRLKGSFADISLSSIFIHDSYFPSEKARMTLFVFPIKEFKEKLLMERFTLRIGKLRTRKTVSVIFVKLPTGLVISKEITTGMKISEITELLYKEMSSMYADLKDKDGYGLRAIGGSCISPHSLFSESLELMEALQRQNLTKVPQFEYIELYSPSKFDEITASYARDLNLLVTDSDEIRALNSALSCTRREVETERLKKWENDPLMARMRLESVRSDESEDGNITMRVQVNGLTEGTNTVAVRVPRTHTVNETISLLFRKLGLSDDTSDSVKSPIRGRMVTSDSTSLLMSSKNMMLRRMGTSTSCGNLCGMSKLLFTDDLTENGEKEEAEEIEKTDPKVLNPSDYILSLTGMDEILAGDNQLGNFVCIRQFLRYSKRVLAVTLEEKQKIIESIRNKEMCNTSKLPELERLSKPIIVRQTGDPVKDLMAGCPHSSVHEKFSIFVKHCAHVRDDKSRDYIVSIGLINGTKRLCPKMTTRCVRGSSTVVFNQRITMNIPISSIPRTARIAFTFYPRKYPELVSTFNFPVFRFDGWMNSGEITRKMWDKHDEDFFLSTSEPFTDALALTFSLPEFRFPVFFRPRSVEEKTANVVPKLDEGLLGRLLKSDLLDYYTSIGDSAEIDEERITDLKTLWKHRDELTGYPELLPLVLHSIDYSNPDMVAEIPHILDVWAKPKPADALLLLDASYPDPDVRKYAVKLIEQFSDHDVMLYLLQLVQALKYELYDYSPLCDFLLRRGLSEPKILGHQLFWQIISESHIPHVRSRFSAFLVNFMYGIGSYTIEFLKGYKFTQQLVQLNAEIQKVDYKQATSRLQKALRQLEIPDEFHLPMDPRLVVESFIIEKCKVMNSKKRPFWLCFKNASIFATDHVLTMFKVGDDLRQDQLTLQIMKVMEDIWIQNDMDMKMRCYGILPTGDMQGFIEIVPNAVTEASIQKEKGLVEGVLAKDIFTNYIKKSPLGWKNAQDLFRLSSAGYAVATSVLGVADRHTDNIMVQQDGHYFHIDFGHFLGNWKTKFGIPRESHLFHFSEACAATINEKDPTGMQKFQDESWNALRELRQNSKLLITLMLLMVGTGLPELKKPTEIRYMKDAMFLGDTDEEAQKKWEALLEESKNSTLTIFNALVHNIKRA